MAAARGRCTHAPHSPAATARPSPPGMCPACPPPRPRLRARRGVSAGPPHARFGRCRTRVRTVAVVQLDLLLLLLLPRLLLTVQPVLLVLGVAHVLAGLRGAGGLCARRGSAGGRPGAAPTSSICRKKALPVGPASRRSPPSARLARAAAISPSKRAFHCANVAGVTGVPCARTSARRRSSASSAALRAASGSTSTRLRPAAAACGATRPSGARARAAGLAERGAERAFSRSQSCAADAIAYIIACVAHPRQRPPCRATPRRPPRCPGARAPTMPMLASTCSSSAPASSSSSLSLRPRTLHCSARSARPQAGRPGCSGGGARAAPAGPVQRRLVRVGVRVCKQQLEPHCAPRVAVSRRAARLGADCGRGAAHVQSRRPAPSGPRWRASRRCCTPCRASPPADSHRPLCGPERVMDRRAGRRRALRAARRHL
jgi:hypothetical protein